MVPPIFLKDQIHDVVFHVVRKINVDVRQLVQRHALLVQETPKIKIEANGANATDAQAITDQTVCRAAARDPVNVAAAAFLQEIPRDEEILLITDIVDDAQFLHGLRLKLARLRPITLAQTFEHEPAQKFSRR